MAKREKQKLGAGGRDADEPENKVEEAEDARADEDSKEADADEEETSEKAAADDEDEGEPAKDDDEEADDEDGEAERAAGGEEASTSKGDDAPSETALATVDDDGEEGDEDADAEDLAATQLGIDRYVLAGFFASGMLGAYILGRTIQALWASFSNKDWFNQSLPRLAGVADDDKTSYSLVLSGIIAVIVVFRTYRRRDVREWCDEVASELAKVVWPSRKEVQSYTFVVIAASAFATIYLTVLDRLWAFITNLVYGDGS